MNKSLWPLLTAAESRSPGFDLNSSLNDSHGAGSQDQTPAGAGIGKVPLHVGDTLLCVLLQEGELFTWDTSPTSGSGLMQGLICP